LLLLQYAVEDEGQYRFEAIPDVSFASAPEERNLHTLEHGLYSHGSVLTVFHGKGAPVVPDIDKQADDGELLTVIARSDLFDEIKVIKVLVKDSIVVV